MCARSAANTEAIALEQGRLGGIEIGKGEIRISGLSLVKMIEDGNCGTRGKPTRSDLP
jgi:hypothetical protein